MLCDLIRQILADDSLDLDTSELSKCEAIEQLIPKFGWPSIYREMLSLLEDHNQSPQNWLTAAQVLWGAVLDKREFGDTAKAIALLYLRIGGADGADENLAWSITSKLKGVDYLSSYNPMKDPEVIAALERLNKPYKSTET